jgi:DNA (cytosine-5)-methyltransferase 1
MTPLTVGSLFAGIGGLELGLERAGMEVKWQVEIDPYCRRVLAKHWPDVARYEDVREVGAHNLEPVDLICGGFPCQDISYAGKGAGLEGERSGLWWEFARTVRALGPRYVLVENVPALLARGIDAVLGTLASFGYDAEWDCIPATAVGAPHRRDRTFIVAYATDKGSTRGLRFARDGQGYGRSGRSRGEGGHSDPRGKADPDAYGAGRHRLKERDGTPEGPGQGATRLHPDGPCDAGPKPRDCPELLTEGRPTDGEWWSVEPDVGRVAHGVPNRVERLRALGNAVVPQVAEYIGRRIVEADAALRESEAA